MITNNKPIALLTPLSDANIEDTLKAVRKARALDALRRMQEVSMKNGNSLFSDEEIQNGISELRNG